MLNELYHIATPWAKATKSQINMNRMLGVAANVLYPVYCAWSPLPKQKTTQGEKMVVSLTTFPLRIGKVYLTIQSILRQSRPADRVLLWLSKEEFPEEAQLPENLLRLKERGLDIRFCDNIRSFKKVFYALFITKVLLKAGGYIYLPCGLYAYYMRDGSALHQETFKPKQFSEITAWERIYALIREQRRPGEESMERTAEERLAVACSHVYYRMAGSDHADPELQAKIVRMAREHWRAALRVPNSKKREKSKLWMLICCPAAGRWMWRLGKKLKQG